GKTFEEPEALKILLAEIVKAKLALGVSKPIMVKISPDIDFGQLDKIISVCEDYKVDGYILTNTAKFRNNLKTEKSVVESIGFGGLSGRPIKQKSTELIRH